MTETKKNPIGRFIENTLVPISTAFAQNRYVRCIGTGSQNLMAIIMIGAVFNLLNSIQIDPLWLRKKKLRKLNLKKYLE